MLIRARLLTECATRYLLLPRLPENIQELEHVSLNTMLTNLQFDLDKLPDTCFERAIHLLQLVIGP